MISLPTIFRKKLPLFRKPIFEDESDYIDEFLEDFDVND